MAEKKKVVSKKKSEPKKVVSKKKSEPKKVVSKKKSEPKNAKFPAHGTYTTEELAQWLNTLDVRLSIGILEKLYKDLRDYAVYHHQKAAEEYVKTREKKERGPLREEKQA